MDLAQLLSTHYPALAPQHPALVQYADRVLDWNARINLVSRKTARQQVPQHILHSLTLTHLLTPAAGTRFLDIGSGGGFPGLALAIVWPQAQFTLNDSILKKTTALQGMAEEMGLHNVEVQRGRAETLPKAQWDFVLGRAVTRIDTLEDWAVPRVHCRSRHTLANGLLYLTGADQLPLLETCRARLKRHWDLHQILPLTALESKVLVYLSNCNA